MSKRFFGSERSFGELAEAIASPDESIRWATILELGGHSEAWAKELIAYCLNDSNEDVAKAAHVELGKRFSPREQSLQRATVIESSLPRNKLVSSFDKAALQIDWSVSASPIAMELSLRKIALESRHLVATNNAPFPQADSFDRIVQILNLFSQGSPSLQDLVEVLDVDQRQVQYYLAAAKYVGLLVEFDGQLRLPSDLLATLESADLKPLDYFFSLAKAAVSVPAVAETFLAWTSRIPSLDRQVAIDALRNSDVGTQLSESTLLRRSRTVYSWTWWVRRILNLFQEAWLSNEFNRQAPLPNFERAIATVERLGERERECLSRNNVIFGSRVGKTLDEVGKEYGISRERVRQIEKDVSERVLSDVERETNWDWKSDLVDFLNEQLTFDSASLISEISGGKLGEAISLLILSKLDCKQVGSTKRYWTINEDELKSRLGQLLALTPMPFEDWISSVYSLGLSPQFLREEVDAFSTIDGVVIDRKRRREHIVLYRLSQVGSCGEQELAALCGEVPSRAFTEALRRNGRFRKSHLTGEWHLADVIDEQSESRFSNVYDAVLSALETDGPLEMSELVAHMEEVYPVSYSRIVQALDHGLIGKLADGRVALISQGATRHQDDEPKLPSSGLWEDRGEVYIHKVVDEDVFRGSGFILPRWLQWKFGLKATPEFVKFSPTESTKRDFLLTRRGGQVYASSIKESLLGNNLEKGCHLAIVLMPENMSWRIEHNHLDCQAHEPTRE